MKNGSVVSLTKKPPKIVVNKKRKREIVKHFASQNNTQYNLSIEYADETKATVREFSMGYVLKEMHINDQVKSPTKTSDEDSSALCIFYNFVNFSKHDLRNPEALRNSQKVQVYKNVKIYFHGIHETNTTKVNIKASKVAEIYLLAQNVLYQIQENEKLIEGLKKEMRDNPVSKIVLEGEIEKKARLKQEFVNIVINMIKRYM